MMLNAGRKEEAASGDQESLGEFRRVAAIQGRNGSAQRLKRKSQVGIQGGNGRVLRPKLDSQTGCPTQAPA